jgi:hypothetical protein
MRGQLNQGKSRIIREGSSEKLNSKERGRAVLILQGRLRTCMYSVGIAGFLLHKINRARVAAM